MPGLLTSQSIRDQIFLVIGASGLCSSRLSVILHHGGVPKLIAPSENLSQSCLSLVEEKNLSHFDRGFSDSDLTSLGRHEVGYVVDGVFVVSNDQELASKIYDQCLRLRIPVNVADTPKLCTFSLLSTYSDGDFQLGVSTTGKGCRLANRLRREMVAALPANISAVCARVGELRDRIRLEDQESIEELGQQDDDASQGAEFNRLILEHKQSAKEQKARRSRWLTQIVEYYPLEKLAEISLQDLSQSYRNYSSGEQLEQQRQLVENPSKGKISLVGSGPGDASLLTSSALSAINGADLILADKLVPSAVLSLIPRRTEVYIARKFPGNAERAQEELLQMGLEALNKGRYVVRLKQGDPYIFGRGGEEYRFFSQHGYEPDVVAGITSALSAPLLAGIPATHRDVADQVLICTGTGRRGALPILPEYVKTRTCVFLMSLHRIEQVVRGLEAKGWDLSLPCAVIERASCPDQRVLRTTLKDVTEAIEKVGSRPPGLLVTGWSCDVISPLLPGERWRVEEKNQSKMAWNEDKEQEPRYKRSNNQSDTLEKHPEQGHKGLTKQSTVCAAA